MKYPKKYWKNENSRPGKAGKLRKILYAEILPTLVRNNPITFFKIYIVFREKFWKCFHP